MILNGKCLQDVQLKKFVAAIDQGQDVALEADCAV